jgi:hypothetical protein
LRGLKQRLEEVAYQLLECFHSFHRLIQGKQSRDLDEPPDVMREELVVHYPSRDLVPFVDIAAVDTDSPFDLDTVSESHPNYNPQDIPFDTCSTRDQQSPLG